MMDRLLVNQLILPINYKILIQWVCKYGFGSCGRVFTPIYKQLDGLPSNTSLSTIVNGVGNVSWVATQYCICRHSSILFRLFQYHIASHTSFYGVNNYGQTFNNATTNFSITQSFADYYNHTVCNQTVPYASWWNNNWLFRAGIDVTASGTITYDDELIQYANFDFAQLIGEVYGGSLTFDPNSIQLIRFDEYFNTTTRIYSRSIRS